MSGAPSPHVLDVYGMKCPMPVIEAKKTFETLPAGAVLKVISNDKTSLYDFKVWAKMNSNAELLEQQTISDPAKGELYVHLVRKGE